MPLITSVVMSAHIYVLQKLSTLLISYNMLHFLYNKWVWEMTISSNSTPAATEVASENVRTGPST